MAQKEIRLMSNYDKLSLDSFKKSLKDGKYATATAARRGIGKATTLSAKEKDQARTAIDAHFGTSAQAAPAKKGAAKKPAAAKTPSVKASPKGPTKKAAAPAKKPATQAKKPAAAKAQPKKTAKNGRKQASTKNAAQNNTGVKTDHAFVGAEPRFDLSDMTTVQGQLRLAEKTIQNVGAAMHVLTSAKKENPTLEFGNSLEEMSATLTGAVGIFRAVINQVSNGGEETKVAAAPIAIPQTAPITAPAIAPVAAPVAAPVNGSVPSRAESLFHSSSPVDEIGTASSV